ncbi:alpha/beta hydrolase, partial [Streptomyces roseolus]
MMPSPGTARPPFDPELDAVLSAVDEPLPTLTLETVPQFRELPLAGGLTDEELEAEGLVRREVTVPGHGGAELAATV